MAETEEKFLIKVNGLAIHAGQETMVAHKILELADEKGAFPGKPEEYMLLGDKGTYNGDDEVNVREDDLLVAIRNRPTPVA